MVVVLIAAAAQVDDNSTVKMTMEASLITTKTITTTVDLTVMTTWELLHKRRFSNSSLVPPPVALVARIRTRHVSSV